MPYKDHEKQKLYQANWIAARRAKFFKDKQCTMKDETCEGGLELDHKDPSKKWSHRIWSYSWKKILRETKKCQILCMSHHHRKTAEDVRKMRDNAHGTQEGYDKWHCRCERCMSFIKSSPDEYFVGISLDEAQSIV